MRYSNTCKKVTEDSWKIFLNMNCVEEIDFENERFMIELNRLTSSTILDVRNGVEKNENLVKIVRDAGYVNEAFEYSRNLAKFAGDIFREKISQYGSQSSCLRIDNPDPELRNLEKNDFLSDWRAEFDVCISDKVVFKSNEEYEEFSASYTVNIRALYYAEKHLERVIKKFKFDIVKRVYLHPGKAIPNDLEKRIIRDARECLKKADIDEFLRLFFISDRRIRERHSQIAEYVAICSKNNYPFDDGFTELEEVVHGLIESDTAIGRINCFEKLKTLVRIYEEKSAPEVALVRSFYYNYCKICNINVYTELRFDRRLEPLCIAYYGPIGLLVSLNKDVL